MSHKDLEIGCKTELDRQRLLAHLDTLSHAEVARLYNQQALESEEAGLIAGYMELHDIDD